jgi:hypothetical protein
MVTISRTSHEIIQFGKNKQPDEETAVTYAEETLIHTKADTSQWHMTRLPDQLISLNFQNYNKRTEDYSDDKCLLSNYADSFEIISVRGFPIKGKIRKEGWLWASSGFAFLKENKQVAVVQLAPEINVWMKKDLTEKFKQIIGSAIISVISTRR